MATLFHLGKWSAWADSPLNLALAIAAGWLLLRPSSIARLTILAAAQVLTTLEQLGGVPNHWLLAGFVGLSILIASGRSAATRGMRDPWPDRCALYEDIAVPGRLMLLTLFFFAGFHKLNADWFHPEVSCGTVLHGELAAKLPFLPALGIHPEAVLYGVVAVELAVPPLLVWTRTRNAGIVLAAAFLFLNGISGFFNFAAIGYALLFLFAPSDLMSALQRRVEAVPVAGRLRAGFRSGPLRWARLLAPALLSAGAALLALTSSWPRYASAPLLIRGAVGGPRPPSSYWVEALWWPYGIACLLLFVAAIRAGAAQAPSAGRMLRPRYASLAVVPLVVALNGASPYLGLKTENAFSMFSNLRTEGARSNHLVVRRPLDPFGYQRDLVRVESSSDPGLRRLIEREYLLPHVELRSYIRERLRHSGGSVEVVYRRPGEENLRAIVADSSDLGGAGSIWIDRMRRFRPVDPGPRMLCRH